MANTELSEFFNLVSQEKNENKARLKEQISNPKSDIANLFKQLESAHKEVTKISDEPSDEKILTEEDQNKLDVFSNLVTTFNSAKKIPEEVLIEVQPDQTEYVEEVVETDTEEVIKTDDIIQDIVSTLDDMGDKTEVKEEIDQIASIRKEFEKFKTHIQQHIANQGMSGGGSGETRLEFLDDIQRSTAKVNNKVLQYSSSDGKWVGATALTGALTDLDIDGGTDIGAALVDADLFIVDDGAGGTNRKTAASRIKTYVSDVTLTTAAQTNITSLGTLTALTVDNIVINGTNIGHTSDTDALAIDSSGNVTASQNLTVSGDLTVTGTTKTVDTVTMEAANAVIFEGSTADGNETTLTIIDPTADHTQRLINQSGYIPLLAATTTTTITSTPEELNILDGATVVVGEINALDLGNTAVGTAIASKAVILDSNKDYTGVRNFTLSGELDAGSLDVSGDADIDGTLEADAITFDGTTLAEFISDTVGAMVGSNTETDITVTYQDSDNTIDFVVGTLNQDTTGTAAIATTVTITDNESTNENNALIFTAGGDVDGGNLGLESDGTLTYNPSTGKITATGFVGALTGAVTGDVTGNADTATALATARTIHGVSFDGSANIDLTEVVEDTVGAMVASNTETGIAVTYQDGDGTIDFAVDAAQTAITSIYNSSLAIGYGASHANINFGTDNQITFDIDGTGQTVLKDGMFHPVTDSDVDLGKSDKYWKDAYIDTITTTGLITSGSNLVIADAGNIGSASDTDAIAIASDGVVTMNQIPVFSAGINVSGGTIAGTLATAAQGNVTSLGTLTTLTVDNIIINGTNIGHTSDTDSIAIASNGVVTFSQAPVFPDGSIDLADLDIDGGTDIGAALADADLLIIDDGAGGTNRKTTMSRVKTYINAIDDATAMAIALG